MSVTRQTLGANTVMITVTADTSTAGVYVLDNYATLLAQVKTEITGKGWTLHDEITPAAGSHIHTLVFEAINADTITHKFMIMRWDTIEQEINISTCEYWNSATHAPINEAYNYGDGTPIPYRQDAYDLVIFVSQYWCILQAFHINEPSQWAGVIEVDREDSVDINSVASYTWSPYNVGTTVPCWGYISSNLWMQGFTTSTATSFDGGQTMDSYSTSYRRSVVCFPRIKSGYTWEAAANYQSVSTEFFTTPNPLDSLGQPRSYRGNLPINVFLSNAFDQGRANTWDSTKKLVYTMKVIEGSSENTFNNRGAIMGIKITKPIGTLMNKVNLPINGKFYYDAAGSITPHFVLNTHGINLEPRSNMTTMRDILFGRQPVSGMSNFNHAMVVGKYVYACSNATLYMLDMTTGTLMGTSGKTQISTGVYTPVYDGNRYIYYSNGSGTVYKLDTQTNTVAASKSLSNSRGQGNIVVTKNYLVSTDITSDGTATINFKFVNLSNFTTLTTVVYNAAAAYSSNLDLKRDEEGSIFFAHGCRGDQNMNISIGKIQFNATPASLAVGSISTFGMGTNRQSLYPQLGLIKAGRNQAVNKTRFILATSTPNTTSGTSWGETTFRIYEVLSNHGATTVATGTSIAMYDNAGATTMSHYANAGTSQSKVEIIRLAGNYVISRGGMANGNSQYFVMTDAFNTSPNYTSTTSTNVWSYLFENTAHGKLYCDGFRVFLTASTTINHSMHIHNNVYSHNLALIGNVITQGGQVLIPA
jgi:hypothetical protein